jgi:acetoin utilization deacetylase AcuC-like enzyme
VKAFYSPDYVVDLGAHVFPTVKFAHAAQKLITGGVLRPVDLIDPGLVEEEALRIVHDETWIRKVFSGSLSLEDETRMEMRWSPALALAHRKCAAGTLAACREALAGGVGIHLGGGAHHAFPDHGEGFCVFNDLAFALETLRREGAIARGAVVDLDVHQGNGTAAILAGRDGLSTLSIHNGGIYPFDGNGTPARSTVDVSAPPGTSDAEYHKILEETLPAFLDEAKPELLLYQAGVDVHEDDLIGGLSMTGAGIVERDRFVAEAAASRRIPLVVTLGGGYTEDPEEAAAWHARTVETALREFERKG